ncbi:hypothetical protein H0H93_009704 [Arthromyces matolae]|nr:hypothetical protein H0H93_009704 [Arthromyces matolae]
MDALELSFRYTTRSVGKVRPMLSRHVHWIRYLSSSSSRRASRSKKSISTMAELSGPVNTSTRLTALRQLMAQKEHDVQAFVIPSEDQHSSEYLADCDKRRAFISGFSGSAGCAVVTSKDAFLFTDGRYFLQAAKQLDQNWKLMKQGLPDVPTWQEFLSKNLEPSTRIGIDPTLISASNADTILKDLEPKGSTLVPIEKNLIDAVWSDRPPRPHNPVIHLDEKYAGQSVGHKIRALREELAKKKYQAFVVNMLDEVAWLFNLRGSDIEYNPVFFSYAVVTVDSVNLFVEETQLDKDVLTHLGEAVNIHPYGAFFDYLKTLPSVLTLDEEAGKYTIAPSPIADLKSVKNATELEGFRQSHIRDGVALARYFAWLEEQLNDGVEVTESQGADKLEAFRSELPLFRGLSFDTISSAGPNAAIIHYKPDPTDCAVIKKDQHFGNPTDEEKRAFTRVLQGHIAMDTAIFPSGTTGYIIDSWARRPLWQDGLDYRHGTGHGVGHYLNVHEGPHGLGKLTQIQAYNSTPLKAGMTVSNEPGYYADGRFGIRIESIVLVRSVDTPNNFGDKGYLGFEVVTMCPIHKKLIDVNLLSVDERKWLNAYHAQTWEKLAPLLKNDERALKWLEIETSPL